MALFTGDWNPLGRDTYYRKFEIYSMAWSEQINVQDLKVAVAPFGGMIAVIRDERRFTPVQTSGKPAILIFSAAGELRSSIKWSGGVVVAIAWTCDEELLCVQNDGSVSVYDMFGTFQNSFHMGLEAKETGIVEASTFASGTTTGLAVLTTNFRFFVVNNVKDPRIRRFPDIPGVNIAPSCWTAFSENRTTRVIAVRDKDVYFLQQGDQHASQKNLDTNHPFLSVTALAVSPCMKHAALLTDSGYVWMGSSDLRVKYCEHDAQCLSPPRQLEWCGSGAVVLNLSTVLLVLSPTKDNFSLVLESPAYLLSEADGLRIVTNTSYEFLQKVAPANQEIFRIGSMAPGAILMEASREFQKRSHRAEEYMRLVRDQLDAAVTQCIDAAGREWQPSVQKLLLRAAQLGKSFLFDTFDKQLLVNMCQTLRMLNAVRHYKTALPLTYDQFQQVTQTGLLDRLVRRRQYSLAVQICRHLRLTDAEGVNRLLTHWACYKIKQGRVDADQLAAEISAKLGQASRVSYSSIALKAIECKQNQLAVRLLDFEHRAAEQIPLLLQLGQEPQALTRAVESGDPNLIYQVLAVLKDNYPSDKFYMTIRAYPAASALYARLCRTMQMGSLEQIYEQEDDFMGQAMLSIHESYSSERLDDRMALLLQAAKQFRRAKSGETWAGLADDQLRLMKAQSGYQDRLGASVLGRSLNDTLKLLLRASDLKEFDDVVKKFKVPERRVWWLKVTTFAATGNWDELEKLSRLKKSPIGYEPFVDVCIEQDNTVEAARYLPRVEESLQVKYYVKAKLYNEAANIAFQRKDTEALHYIQSRCASQRDTVDKINSLIAKLASPSGQQQAKR